MTAQIGNETAHVKFSRHYFELVEIHCQCRPFSRHMEEVVHPFISAEQAEQARAKLNQLKRTWRDDVATERAWLVVGHDAFVHLLKSRVAFPHRMKFGLLNRCNITVVEGLGIGRIIDAGLASMDVGCFGSFFGDFHFDGLCMSAHYKCLNFDSTLVGQNYRLTVVEDQDVGGKKVTLWTLCKEDED